VVDLRGGEQGTYRGPCPRRVLRIG